MLLTFTFGLQGRVEHQLPHEVLFRALVHLTGVSNPRLLVEQHCGHGDVPGVGVNRTDGWTRK